MENQNRCYARSARRSYRRSPPSVVRSDFLEGIRYEGHKGNVDGRVARLLSGARRQEIASGTPTPRMLEMTMAPICRWSGSCGKQVTQDVQLPMERRWQRSKVLPEYAQKCRRNLQTVGPPSDNKRKLIRLHIRTDAGGMHRGTTYPDIG